MSHSTAKAKLGYFFTLLLDLFLGSVFVMGGLLMMYLALSPSILLFTGGAFLVFLGSFGLREFWKEL